MSRSPFVVPALLLALCALPAAIPVQALQAGPDRNIRLVFQLVEANGFQDTDEEIRDVVAELRELFRFRGYRLVATGLLNTTVDASAQTRLTGDERGGYVIQTWVGAAEGDPSKDPRVSVELHHEGHGPAMEATVRVHDGQTLVLGSTRTLDGEALILIMRVTYG